ncbi:cation-transporting P-type ATPase [Kineosporia sp. A_224]|uniref:cation-translocating P-type ATPase n=1 Tax=Kineosporia sp. A_224 TaxID=1962180 RepID=UPI0018E944A6|nr:cation-transporting P-type ATPase [Kineosporia sp. A_224]
MSAAARLRPAPGTTRPWHLLLAGDVAADLGVSPTAGLDAGEVRRRQALHGPNALPTADRRSRLTLLLDQVRDPLVLLLLGAGVIASLVGDLKDAAVILAVILVNSVLGIVQEFRAENSLESLRAMLAPTCVVRRDGDLTEVAAVELVPGDVVVLEAGGQVPADGRLSVAEQLEVDESALTGESVPSAKRVDPVPDEDAPLGDRWSLVFMNTVVTRGRGELIVVGTGPATEMGRLADLIRRTPVATTPLQRQLAQLGRRLAAIGGAAVAIYLAIGLLRGQPWHEIVLSGVALAVAAVPEGLPVVVTVTLAVGVHHMAGRGALVKQLASVETLGATSVVCTDKTGTLTVNQMTVREVWIGGHTYSVSGEGYQPHGEVTDPSGVVPGDGRDVLRRLARAAALCNDSTIAQAVVIGDPMEAALLVMTAKIGLDPHRLRAQLPRIAEVPFDARHRYMATVHPQDGPTGQTLVAVKGALDALLDRCALIAQPDGAVGPLDDIARTTATNAMTTMAARGLRVLAIADRELPAAPTPAGADVEGLVEQLTFLGLVALQDPPRPGVVEAIAACHGAGIDVKMITGDHAVTAEAIAGELGITGRTCTGAEIDAGDSTHSADLDGDRWLVDVGVFARVSPEHKLRIVRALQRAGHVTAMTGDGVNDAPALRAADIGVAMGKTGTQVSRDAAAMVLTDDHFATIVRAVEAGRTIYANILSFLRFQLTTNIAAIAMLLTASAAGLPAPLTAIQILWVNMIMDGPPAVALGMDPAEPDTMRRAPRPAREHLLPLPRIAVITLNGSVMALGTLALLRYGTAAWPTGQAVTAAFTTFVLFQVVSALTVRSATLSVFHRRTFTNRALWIALSFIVLLQVVVVTVPQVQGLFGTAALTPTQWLLACATASVLLLVDETRKLAIRLRAGSGAHG